MDCKVRNENGKRDSTIMMHVASALAAHVRKFAPLERLHSSARGTQAGLHGILSCKVAAMEAIVLPGLKPKMWSYSPLLFENKCCGKQISSYVVAL